MRAQQLGNEHVLVLDPGDEVVEALTAYLDDHHIHAGRFLAIGGFKRFQLRYFSTATMQYEQRDFKQQVEVLTLAGNVSLRDGRPFVHPHVVLGTADYQTLGGHLGSGVVEPTLELFLTDLAGELRREHDARTGLGLLRPR